jgi:hypothetical protein
MKRILIAAILLLSSGIQALENETPVHKVYENEEKQLLNTADLFLSHLNQASSWDTAQIDHQASLICAPKCRKIVNGKVIFEERESYALQLSEIKKIVGTWSIHPVEILPYVDRHLVVIRQLVVTEKTGILTVFLILRCNEEFKITEIDEVYSQFEGKVEVPNVR